MWHFIVSRLHSFGHALRGLAYVVRTQRNAWIHVVISVVVLVLSLWLRLNPLEWAIIILTMAMVFTAEFLNTAIEAVVDLASPHKHPLAKVGKDVGAGAVLIAAIAAILVGLLILWPPLWERLSPLFVRR
jgi:diacylglycerol kinase (ATP)